MATVVRNHNVGDGHLDSSWRLSDGDRGEACRANAVLICCVSDTHGDHAALDPLPHADILLHAGDFTSFGREEDARKFNDWGKAQTHLSTEQRIVVLGNHENVWVHSGQIERLRAMIPDWTLLVDQPHSVAGLIFYGSCFLPEIDSECQTVALPTETDVLVTHNPPHGHLDQGGGGHVALRRASEAAQPKLHVFGHIHGGFGTKHVDWRLGGTLLVNAANCGNGRKICNPSTLVAVTPGPAGHADLISPASATPSTMVYVPASLPTNESDSTDVQNTDESDAAETALKSWMAPKLARPMCGRNRGLKVCGCTIPCRVAMRQISIDPICEGLLCECLRDRQRVPQ